MIKNNNNKILKKLLGAFGYKIFPKDQIKSERILNKNNYSKNLLIKNFVLNNNVNKIIQLGANDGVSADIIHEDLKKDLSIVIVEPLKNIFVKLKKRYEDNQNIKLVNKAIDISNEPKRFFKIKQSSYEYYKNKINGSTDYFLSSISSFKKNHIKEFGIKDCDIISEKVECLTFKDLIKKFNFQNVDLVICDLEGYDGLIVNDILSSDFQPHIIFEWIWIDSIILHNLCNDLKKNGYKIFKLDHDVLCFKQNIKLTL